MLKDVKSPYGQIDTPALLIDGDILMKNIKDMQDKADSLGVALRPHTKTHKTPLLAKLQMQQGAKGITVAKVGEAEEMAKEGISDIFIANEIAGKTKLERIKKLAAKNTLSFGVDSLFSLNEIEEVFDENVKANVLIELEVGENRSGVVEEKDFLQLVEFIKNSGRINFLGVFSHEGFTYKASSQKECLQAFAQCQKRTLHFAQLARRQGLDCPIVSVGATPTAWLCKEILKGITEIRPGTYILMDCGQANAIGTYERCAATVLTTVISKPTDTRVITDVGAKGLTMQSRSAGICKTQGLGLIKNTSIHITSVYDEHAIIYSPELYQSVEIGDKIEIIPNHICPVSNLYDNSYLVQRGVVKEKMEISCRGKLQ